MVDELVRVDMWSTFDSFLSGETVTLQDFLRRVSDIKVSEVAVLRGVFLLFEPVVVPNSDPRISIISYSELCTMLLVLQK